MDGIDLKDWDAAPVWDSDSRPRIFVGSLSSTEDLGFVDAGVTHVLTVAARLKPSFPVANVTHLQVDATDHPQFDILQVLSECVTFISEALSKRDDNVVLVHCASGVSRSVTVCVAYMMLAEDFLLTTPCAWCNAIDRALSRTAKRTGSVETARAQWIEKHVGGIMTGMIAQREEANEIHALADRLEERVAKAPADANAEILSELHELEARIAAM
eukprot:CAMPEP_0114571108 /NCGR_PEP_ID=MMETSP0114-20121206/17573_1 /TAXON_ID=31324 /ORGANISM="Goniomonas sp, Strain m" /LENGTH=214 /DNA_ID=CAMNT_0001758211 /DNA_START=1 /DNA_END=643 /DNA_ORIENTATION=+